MRGSTSWSAYLERGWVDVESVHGALDGHASAAPSLLPPRDPSFHLR